MFAASATSFERARGLHESADRQRRKGHLREVRVRRWAHLADLGQGLAPESSGSQSPRKQERVTASLLVVSCQGALVAGTEGRRFEL